MKTASAWTRCCSGSCWAQEHAAARGPLLLGGRLDGFASDVVSFMKRHALDLTEPKLIMLDEPSLGLSPLLVQEIFGIIGTINAEQGMSVLLVEQNAAATLDIVSRAYLIEQGQVVMSGAAEVLKSNPDVQDFYLGGAEHTDYRNVKHYRRRKRWLA